MARAIEFYALAAALVICAPLLELPLARRLGARKASYASSFAATLLFVFLLIVFSSMGIPEMVSLATALLLGCVATAVSQQLSLARSAVVMSATALPLTLIAGMYIVLAHAPWS